MALTIDAKFWRKTDFSFQKWLEEFGKFSPEHVRKSKNLDFYWVLLSKVEIYELKIYREVMCHENEEWCKIWKGIDFSIQNWHEEFDQFWPEHSKISKISTLMSCFWQKYIMFETKKYRGVMSDYTEEWCKIWSKTDLCFLKWHEEFGKFSLEEVSKSKNLDFYWVLLSKVKNVWT